MNDHSTRRNRRSHPNLHLISVKPLTTHSLTNEDENSRSTLETPKSYIASRSLPQTPSILSRSNSRTRISHNVGSKSSYAVSDLPEAADFQPKSTRSRHHSRSNSTRTRSSNNKDWLMQTASALALSTAESKGQAWLATRMSSTSLTNMPQEQLPPESAYRADDEFSPVSFRHPSRSQSRFGSAYASRRGSKVGLMTPLGFRTPGERDEQAGYFDNMTVDFADDESLSSNGTDDDDEVKKLVVGRVGGWVDWAIGWMDFRNDDLIEDESEQSTARPTNEDGTVKRRRKQISHEQEQEQTEDNTNAIPPAPVESAGVLSDAGWLLGVAKSVLI